MNCLRELRRDPEAGQRIFLQPLHHALLLFFCEGTVKFGLLTPVADHAGNAGLARDTGSVGVYIALLGLGRLRLGGCAA